MIDVRRLRVLLAVRENGGVGAAARALDFTSPAVSQQIAALERQVGRPLLDRTSHRARLTPAGERLAEHAAAVLARLEEAESDLAGFGGRGPVGAVAVGSIPTVGRAALPDVVRRLVETAPDLRLRIEQAEPEDSLPAVARGDLDVAVMSQYSRTPRRRDYRLEWHTLAEEPLLVALPAHHALAGGDIALAALSDQPWIAPADPSSCFTMLQRSCAAAGFEPLIVGHCADFAMALALVGAGQGVALVPAIATTGEPADGVHLARITDVPASRTLYAATRHGTAGHPGIAAFVSALRWWWAVR